MIAQNREEIQIQVQYKLVEELKARVHQKEVIVELGQKALAGCALNELFEETAELVPQTLGVEFCGILEALPEGENLLLRAGYGWNNLLTGTPLTAPPDFLEIRVLSTGKPIIENASGELVPIKSIFKEQGAKSGICCLIGNQQKIFGAIGTYTAQKRAFNTEDINFLQAIANVLTMAVDRKRDEERLLRLSRTFLDLGMDFRDNLNVLTGAAGELLGASCAIYSRLDEGQFQMQGRWNSPSGLDCAGNAERHICMDVIKHCRKGDIHVQKRNFRNNSPNCQDCLKSDYGFQMYVGHPVHLSGEPIGALCVLYRKEMLFDEDDRRILRIIALAIGAEEEKRNTAAEKEKLQIQLVKAQKIEAIGRLAGGIAHDFNNLLTGISANVSFARMLVPPEHKIFKIMSDVEEASLRARDLTKQLLTFSKGGAPAKKTASIRDLLRDSTIFLLRGSNIKCEFDLSEDLWRIEADTGQISQVIQNLVLNAAQAMPNGGRVIIKATNLATLEKGIPLPPGKYIKITVRDTGIGIPEENLDKIFDPYFTTKEEGNGLGLATAYSVILKHEGHISVRSEKNAGTEFIIYLPAANNTTIKEIPFIGKSLCGSGRILIMDDQEMILNAAEEILRSIGYTVCTVSDGAEALKVYEDAMGNGKPFDVVIMDLTIPGGMGGKETIEKLLLIDPKAKTIVSSGYSDDCLISEYKRYGFKAMLSKPYLTSELRAALQEVMGS